MQKKQVTVWILAAVLAFFAIAPAVHASAVGVTVRPIKISHTMEASSTVSGIITLTNASEEPVEVSVGIEDFIPTAGTTNVEFVGRAEGNTTVRDWITLDVTEPFEFNQKGQTKTVHYTVTAPPEAEPGSHFGVIFFKANKIDNGGQLKVGTRVGILTFITIPGDRLQQGNILGFSSPKFVQGGPVPFQISFENTGTVHYEPKGTISIRNLFGKVIGEVPVQGQAVLPTGRRDLQAAWDTSRLLFGRYTAEVVIYDGEGNSLSAERIAFYAFPIWYTIWFVLATTIFFFGVRFIKRRVKFSVSLK